MMYLTSISIALASYLGLTLAHPPDVIKHTYPPGHDPEAIARDMAAWRPDHGRQIWTLSGLREGDIMDAAHTSRNVIRDPNKLWWNGIVPYAIQPGLTEYERLQIVQGMNLIMQGSCIRFRPYRYTDRDYLYLRYDEVGCWSYIGRQGGGGQVVSLARGVPEGTCLYHGVVAHELLHALGFEHQHNAVNRDQYVYILYNNIRPGEEYNFVKISAENYTDYGIAYDYDSVMHYGRTAFSGNGGDTIVPYDPNAKTGQQEFVSYRDFQKLNIRYNCVNNG
ncbi:zinc metalloproteinase nas-14-like [Neocloeon triangulifer]|uniref:zinc metalloproteinase nas-14-like n=1 Tax=Neocloeon triangulifer TaxID=2078957 RepID=UPI00286F610B|nr:zinc metalloproteinase nas-14-like [Neocloeon triangulifer]